ncbi:MAG: alpha/beta hydrolase, partial [Actinomycetota bacterium]
MSQTLAPATDRYVAAEGVRFHLWRSDPAAPSSATPTLLLHGVPQTAVMWRDVLPVLAADRVVLAPDLKGLGDSEVRGPYDVPTLAGELAALVLHEVDGQVDIVGHDWGGVLALAIARLRPDLVRRLVIINAPYRDLKWHRAPHIAGFALPAAPEAVFRLSGERVIRTMLRTGWRSEPALPDDIADHYAAAYAEPHRTAAMLGYYRAFARPAAARALRGARRRRPATKARAPISVQRSLVLWGAADP